ncbi:MAG: hypothetical protein OEM39_00895, partial [Acidimicrobiia bacterium]|nr:hypothetical protein [Acidimicrobiia bacterium]
MQDSDKEVAIREGRAMLGRRQRVLPLAILLLHLAAACGGGGDADADGATTTVPSTDGPIVLSTVAGLSDECAGLANLVSGIV